MAHVYISFTHEDLDFAENLKAQLEKGGITAFLANAIVSPGENWRTRIDEAIKSSYALIVVMTPAARQSEWVNFEWSYAIGQGIPVVPVMLHSTRLPMPLEMFQYL